MSSATADPRPKALRAVARADRRALRANRLRRITPRGTLLALLTIGIAIGGSMLAVPDRQGLAPTGDRKLLAGRALADGDAGPAWIWLREQLDRLSAGKDAEFEVDLAQAMHAGYVAGAARNLLNGNRRSEEFRGLIINVMQADQTGQQLVQHFFTERPDLPGAHVVLRDALDRVLMAPTLMRVGRTAAGLPLPGTVPEPLAPGTEQATGTLGGVGILRRLFAFVRDSVAVVPDADRPITGEFRWPIDVLFHGSGTLPEVDWLFCRLVNLLSGESPDGATWAAFELQIPLPDDAGVAEDAAWGRRLAIVLQIRPDSQPVARLFGFDLWAGVPLLDENGHLLDLFEWRGGVSRIHPALAEHLAYARNPRMLANSRVSPWVNPLETGPMGAWLARRGLMRTAQPGSDPATIVQPGPSPLPPTFAGAAGTSFATDDDRNAEPTVPDGAPKQISELLEQLRMRGHVPPPPDGTDELQFPWQWTWAVSADDWWLARTLHAALRRPPSNPTIIERLDAGAEQMNRLYRQRLLDYHRPADATDSFDARVYSGMGTRQLESIAWPRERAKRRNQQAQFGPPSGTVLIDDTKAVARPQVFAIREAVVDAPVRRTILLLNRSGAPVQVHQITLHPARGMPDDRGAFRFEPDPVGRVIEHALLVDVVATPTHSGTSVAIAQLDVEPVGGGDARSVQFAIEVRTAPPISVPGRPDTVTGAGGFTSLPRLARTLLPIAEAAAENRSLSLNARFGVAWADFQGGQFAYAALSCSDFFSSMESEAPVGPVWRIPWRWKPLAALLHGRALQVSGQAGAAPAAFARIERGPLWVAGRCSGLLLPARAIVTR